MQSRKFYASCVFCTEAFYQQIDHHQILNYSFRPQRMNERLRAHFFVASVSRPCREKRRWNHANKPTKKGNAKAYIIRMNATKFSHSDCACPSCLLWEEKRDWDSNLHLYFWKKKSKEEIQKKKTKKKIQIKMKKKRERKRKKETIFSQSFPLCFFCPSLRGGKGGEERKKEERQRKEFGERGERVKMM